MNAQRLFFRIDDVGADEAATAFCEALAEDGIPVAAAVVPDWLTPRQGARLARLPGLTVLQHGYAHINRRRVGHADEFPDAMPEREMRSQLRDGRRRLEETFGRRVGIYAPPWNRVACRACRILVEMGFDAVSGHTRFPVTGPLRDVGATVDAARRYAPVRLRPIGHLAAEIASGTAVGWRDPLGVFYHVDGLSRVEWRQAVSIARRLAATHIIVGIGEAARDDG